MFKTAYQGGVSVEVFSTQDKKLQKAWKFSSNAKRIFSKDVKGYIYALEGDKGYMQMPTDDKTALHLSKFGISIIENT